MFSQSVAETTIRSAAVVAATSSYAYLSVDGAAGPVPNPGNTAHTVQFELGTFTTGSVTATFQGSVDGSTYFDMPSSIYAPFTFSSSTSGTRRYWDVNSVAPGYLRVKLTKSGSPDGTIGIVYRTDR